MARSVSASGTGSLLKHLFTALDKIRALHHHDAPTAQAFDFDICADADNRPFVASAGMRFPHPDPSPRRISSITHTSAIYLSIIHPPRRSCKDRPRPKSGCYVNFQ